MVVEKHQNRQKKRNLSKLEDDELKVARKRSFTVLGVSLLGLLAKTYMNVNVNLWPVYRIWLFNSSLFIFPVGKTSPRHTAASSNYPESLHSLRLSPVL